MMYTIHNAYPIPLARALAAVHYSPWFDHVPLAHDTLFTMG